MAAAQSVVGRLPPDVRAHAIQVIDSGSDLQRWSDADSNTLAKRQSVLVKLREQLEAEQPSRKKIRRVRPPQTTLVPGDVLSFRAASGRRHLLRVRALYSSRYGLFSIVDLLDFEGIDVPSEHTLGTLSVRTPPVQPDVGRRSEIWWNVEGKVIHKRGSDFADFGFELVGHIPTGPTALLGPPTFVGSSGLVFWRDYLQRQDELLGDRIVAPDAP